MFFLRGCKINIREELRSIKIVKRRLHLEIILIKANKSQNQNEQKSLDKCLRDNKFTVSF